MYFPAKQVDRTTGVKLFILSKRILALQGGCGVYKRSDGQQGKVFWFTSDYYLPCPEDEIEPV